MPQEQVSNAVIAHYVGGAPNNGVQQQNPPNSSQGQRHAVIVGNNSNNSSEQETNNNNQQQNNNNTSDSSEQNNNEDSQNTPTTLVQTVGNRPFKLVSMAVEQRQMLVLSFPRGLTLLMGASDINRPAENGVAQLDVHRKFLPSFKKYLHWISFTFQGTGRKVQAQIMLPTRLSAACQLVQGGASACFLHCPFRIQRRPQVASRRTNVNRRR